MAIGCGLKLVNVGCKVPQVHDRMISIVSAVIDYRKLHPEAKAAPATRGLQLVSPMFKAIAMGPSLAPIGPYQLGGDCEFSFEPAYAWACLNCGTGRLVVRRAQGICITLFGKGF